MNMKLRHWAFRGLAAIWIGLVLLANQASALQINRTSDGVIYIDTSSSVYCSYASYQVINNDGVSHSNLWVKIDSFTSGKVGLNNTNAGQYNLGTLGINQTNTVFFYLQATNTVTTNETHTIRVFRGRPDVGTQLTNQNFTLTVSSSMQNNSQKINTVSVGPNPPTLGGLFAVTVTGETGTIGGVNKVNFTPAVYTNWDAVSYQLVSSFVTAAGGNTGTFSNTLAVTFSSQANTFYTNTFWFRAVAVAATNSVSPLSIQSGGGGNFSHAVPPSAGVIPAIQSATNQTVLTNFASVAQLYTNEIVTYTVRLTNLSTNNVVLDAIVDTLPPGFTYVTNSSQYNGVMAANPVANGQLLTWSEPYNVPASTSHDFTFQAVPSTNGYATNSVYALAKDTRIDTTLVTTDNVPATVSVRVLLPPTATNDNGTTLEDTALSVSAPGVLANDNEPNGFAISVVAYTQPAHGSVTVNADGSYAYVPTTNYNGADSFTYTLTNGNARASSATVSLTLTAVNDAPTLNPTSNLTTNEDGGLQTVSLTGISVGPTNEVGQTLTVTATSSNPALIPHPTVNYTSPNTNGTLTFTPTANSNGVATITVIISDNGGTANGGGNAVTNTFTVTIIAVNDPPSFTKGADQTTLEDGGAQSVSGWVTAINAGPADESAQSVSFSVSNNNSNLFSAQPALSVAGTLTYTPATNANGSATVTVIAQDNGGAANGGNDTSAAQTFTITVTPVDDVPALNPISNVSLVSNWNLQTVNLSGISSGPANEAGQTLTVTATSSNPSLVPSPMANYTSPSATGTLTFTPATNLFGTASITVIVRDNGGTANGGVDSVTNTFTITETAFTNRWSAGSNLTVNISDATGVAGTGFSQTNYSALDVTATSTNPFTLKLASFNGALPGRATNFNSASNYTWTIATTLLGVTGFTTNKLVVDTSAFTNDLAGGYFSVGLATNGTSVNLRFTGNTGPSASPATFTRTVNTSIRIPIISLLTNYTADPDGDARVLLSVGSSTNGSFLSTNSIYILFAPSNNVTESFTFVVRDARTYRPGDTIFTATNRITIQAIKVAGYAQSITTGGGGVTVGLAGIPGYAYDLERATNIGGPWGVVFTTNAPATGVWIYTDSSPPSPSAYYRTSQH